MEMALPNVVSQQVSRRLNFGDVEEALVQFTGDTAYGIKKWLADFEITVATMGYSELDRILIAKRRMSGTARLFVNSMSNVQSWGQFKQAMIEEFDRHKTLGDIYRQLSARHRGKEETFHHYILTMKDIASQGTVEELELVRFIVDGLGDRSPHAAMLYCATTVKQLKEMMDNYDYHRGRTAAKAPLMPKRQPAAEVAGSEALKNVRCYNCNTMGHYQSTCTQDQKPKGSCYQCGQPGHISRDCPSKRQSIGPMANRGPRKTAAAIDDWNEGDADQDGENVAAIQPVSVTFHIDRDRHEINSFVNALLDTGSPVSFIERSAVAKGIVGGELRRSGFSGLGNTFLYTYGKISTTVAIGDRERLIILRVLPDNILPSPLLLGRDALKSFGIGLFYKKALHANLNNKIKNVTLEALHANLNNKNKCRDLSPIKFEYVSRLSLLIIYEMHAITLMGCPSVKLMVMG